MPVLSREPVRAYAYDSARACAPWALSVYECVRSRLPPCSTHGGPGAAEARVRRMLHDACGQWTCGTLVRMRVWHGRVAFCSLHVIYVARTTLLRSVLAVDVSKTHRIPRGTYHTAYSIDTSPTTLQLHYNLKRRQRRYRRVRRRQTRCAWWPFAASVLHHLHSTTRWAYHRPSARGSSPVRACRASSFPKKVVVASKRKDLPVDQPPVTRALTPLRVGPGAILARSKRPRAE
jgi:hypothetical protein